MLVSADSIVEHVFIATLGGFELYLDMQKDYKIIFSKKKEFSKTVYFDTHVPKRWDDYVFSNELYIVIKPEDRLPASEKIQKSDTV